MKKLISSFDDFKDFYDWLGRIFGSEKLPIHKISAKDEKHINKLSKEKGVFVYKSEFHKTQEVESPIQGIDKAYSTFSEIELLVDSFETLVYITIHYGPSSIEIIKPERIDLKISEAQNIVNNIAEILHRYAAAGIGGIVISAD